ncbi:MAG: hypothetical protein ABFD92_21000 [Planctomycetaceae bacterium]
MKTTKAERDEIRRQIAEADNAGNGLELPPGGGILAEALDDLDEATAALRGLYGTVSVKPTWERQWPHIAALVKAVLEAE